MTNPKKIITLLKEKLESNSSVIGFVLAGSYARDFIYRADKYSDMEVYIIVEDDRLVSFERQLPSLVNKLGSVVFSYKNRWAGFSTVYDNLFRLELPLVKRSEISSVFSRPKAQPVKVLIDKTQGELKSALDKRPEKIDFEKVFSETVEDFWYMTIVAVQYYKKSENWHARHAQEVIMIPSFIKLMMLMENPDILLLEANKKIEEFLPKKYVKTLKDICPPYDVNQIRQSLERNIEEFSKIAKNVAKKYNWEYPVALENKIRPKLENLLAGNK